LLHHLLEHLALLKRYILHGVFHLLLRIARLLLGPVRLCAAHAAHHIHQAALGLGVVGGNLERRSGEGVFSSQLPS
jgi:hypothetical protein